MKNSSLQRKVFVCLIVVAIIGIACNKDKVNPVVERMEPSNPTAHCNLMALVSPFGEYHYEYDSLNRMQQLKGGFQTYQYQYGVNRVLVIRDTPELKRLYVLNELGFAISSYIDLDTLGFVEYRYYYDSQHQLIRLESGGNVYGRSFIDYYYNEWENGDLVKQTRVENDFKTVYTYTYDLTKYNQYKPNREKSDFVPQSKHLPICAYKNNEPYMRYEYQFDSLGKITASYQSFTPYYTVVWDCK